MTSKYYSSETLPKGKDIIKKAPKSNGSEILFRMIYLQHG